MISWPSDRGFLITYQAVGAFTDPAFINREFQFSRFPVNKSYLFVPSRKKVYQNTVMSNISYSFVVILNPGNVFLSTDMFAHDHAYFYF